MFPIMYKEIRDLRENTSIEVLPNEDMKSICKKYIEENLSKVTIYFEDMKLESIIQQPGYESFNLVCDIGGSLGLFFGASIVTFIEILDFFTVQFWKSKMANKKPNV
ncbi:acid-sensing ion channel 1A-like [Glandiceps talaboti]